MPYLFMNSCASIGCSRVTPIGGVVDIVLVSMNIPFSRRYLLFLQAALPLFLTTILQSAIMKLILRVNITIESLLSVVCFSVRPFLATGRNPVVWTWECIPCISRRSQSV